MDDLITLNLTLKELQQIDKYVEVNDNTVSVLTKIKNAYPKQKSPVEEAYKDAYGYYPDIEYNMNSFPIFKKGYEAAQKDYKVGEPYCPDDPILYDEVEWDEKDNPPEPTSTAFRQKLFDGIKSVFYDPDYERTHWKMKVNMAVDEVLTHFYDIIPKSEESVWGDFDEGWESCLKCIKMRMEHTDD